MTGTQMQHVIYKETSMLYTGVANGELNLALGSLRHRRAAAARRQAEVHRGHRARSAIRPSPTCRPSSESGGPAGYEVTRLDHHRGAQGRCRSRCSTRSSKDIEAALAEPDIKERYATFGYEAFPVTREQFNAFIAAESTKYADVIKRSKVSLD